MNDAKQISLKLFHELAENRTKQLEVTVPAAQKIIQQALLAQFNDTTAHDIAFHLTDWASDGAFLIALILFPERFTEEQIRDGIELFTLHAPNHIAAAAKLSGWPVQDIFGIGALDSLPDDDDPTL
ncbi:MAG: hypothetical protein WCD79_14075 [Chthoniobacteraceae bacterium]